MKKPCPALAEAHLAEPFYAIRLDAALEPNALAIASFSATPDLRVRSCTSAEGVHLTAWSGKPLSGKRLWHEYVYLGYDADPTCTSRDYVE